VARFFQLPDADIGQADVADLAGALPVDQRPTESANGTFASGACNW